MDLRRIIWVVLLLYIQLLGTSSSLEKLTTIQLKFPEGADTLTTEAEPIECGVNKTKLAAVKDPVSPSKILELNNLDLKEYAFTADTVHLNKSSICGNKEKFVMAKLESRDRTEYALRVDKKKGEKAYWLPMKGHIMIPRTPKSGQPKYVFTPDLNGSTLTVTPSCSGYLHLRHIPAGKKSAFNKLKPDKKGGYYTHALEYEHYGYVLYKNKNMKGNRGFAYLRYYGGRWNLHVQSKSCAGTNYQAKNPVQVEFTEFIKKISKPDYQNYEIPDLSDSANCIKDTNIYKACESVCQNGNIPKEDEDQSCPRD